MTERYVKLRKAALLCLCAFIVLGGSLVLRSDAYQEWRLDRLALPRLFADLKLHGDNSRMLYYVGMRLDQAGRYVEAEEYLQRGVGLDPASARLREEWARALIANGKVSAAFGELRQFAGSYPCAAESHYILGKFYFSRRSMVRASDEFDAVTRLDPGRAEAFLYLAGAHDALRETEPARKAAAQAVALRPNSKETHLCLASMSGRAACPYKVVRAEFEKAIALGPDSAAAHQEFARWLADAGRPEDLSLVSEHARRAIDLGLRDSTAYLVLGRACTYGGDYAGAISPLTQAARLAPDDPVPALALSQAYRSLKLGDCALEWRRRYLLRQSLRTEKDNLMQAIAVAPHDLTRRAALETWRMRHAQDRIE